MALPPVAELLKEERAKLPEAAEEAALLSLVSRDRGEEGRGRGRLGRLSFCELKPAGAGEPVTSSS